MVAHPIDPAMRECIGNCTACHAICQETATHCLTMGGEHASPEHVGSLLDCVQICATSADFMLRASKFHKGTCGVCADVCDACAADCERLGCDDQLMQRCAQACRRCADSCRRMAA